MAEPGAPLVARWIGSFLRAIPGPSEAWADIVGHLAWPVVAVFLVYRFRRYLRVFLGTIANRLQTDHIKIGTFEFTPNSPVWVLDPDEVDESTFAFDGDDVRRIEAIFEFVGQNDGYHKVMKWLNQATTGSLKLEDFVTRPEYATLRARAFREIEGLSI
ncbi:hypothetical protein BSL82_01155 [Tardibacter chloracetimidivorans]|uniref:Uncharacterized protein n=1 Tax=Tardibacter chloracetimidivorans TaxID=1921510 RepID=A0A1L3ZR30_9SPHN|nr:hypothetical protein [Tardibacter chloracetimidivorans]API58073.1 hypothetical protein BSL82_01155 [Tardibacter chloracetimidivorans]